MNERFELHGKIFYKNIEYEIIDLFRSTETIMLGDDQRSVVSMHNVNLSFKPEVVLKKQTIFEIKDGRYGMQITKDWNKYVIKLEPTEHGTGLNKKSVIRLIAVLSKWVDERENDEL